MKTRHFAFIISLFIIPTAWALPNKRTSPLLVDTWAKLDTARTYREDWRGTMPKTHTEMITAYKDQTVEVNLVAKTPQQWFLESIAEFRSWLDTTADTQTITEAGWGLQESINEYMAGQSLIGNDYLIKGLRVRFPGVGDPADASQLSLLSWSEDTLAAGIDAVIEDLRKNPDLIRSGDPGFPFAFFVENSTPGDGNGPIVESEAYRFTNLIDRYGMASNSKGKRMFFFDNVKDTDNFPYNNFPGTEDLDLNGDGFQNEAGRQQASDQVKKSAHATYLHTAILTAIQSEQSFQDSNGYRLKRQINDAEQVFDDIKQGFNPLKLQGDFVPYQPVENFLSLARARVRDAVTAENAAAAAERTYDTDKTTLQNTLESQQLTYINRIEQISGLKVDGYDFTDPEQVQKFLDDAELNSLNGIGELGLQQVVIDESVLAMEQQDLALKQIPERIRLEQDRHRSYAELTDKYGKKYSALTYASALANSISIELSWPPSVSFNPQAALAGYIQGEIDILRSTQQIEVDGIQSSTTIKQLLLEQATAFLSLQRVQKSLERELARKTELKNELARTINNYKAAQTNFLDAYYNNPAYRLDRDQLIEAAEISFATAMTESYYAAKALEYLWSEKFNNPVMRLDGGLPEALSNSFDPYIRAESVFASHFASVKSPNLDDYLDALQAWDLKMRQLRVPSGQSGSAFLSLRKDILGFTGSDEALNVRLFKDFIEKHRIKGQNVNNRNLLFEFSIEIGDQKLLPAHPNLKLEQIAVNLVSHITGSVRGEGGVQPVLVDLIQLDEAHVRSFFTNYPTDDDILIYHLEQGRTLDKSPFKATVEADVDNHSYPTPKPNVQLRDHSPAVSRWALRIDTSIGQNRLLELENLEDIEIIFNYHYGKPRNVGFVQ